MPHVEDIHIRRYIENDDVDAIRELITSNRLYSSVYIYIHELESWLLPIHLAALYGRAQILRMLLQESTSCIDAQTEKRYNLLEGYTYAFTLGIVKAEDKLTALHLASRHGPHINCIMVLLEFGANYMIKDARGNLPFSINQLFSFASQTPNIGMLDLTGFGCLEKSYLEQLKQLSFFSNINKIKISLPDFSLTDVYTWRKSMFYPTRSRINFDFYIEVLDILSLFPQLNEIEITVTMTINTGMVNNQSTIDANAYTFITGYQGRICQRVGVLLEKCPYLTKFTLGTVKHQHTETKTTYRQVQRQYQDYRYGLSTRLESELSTEQNTSTKTLYTLDHDTLGKIGNNQTYLTDMNSQAVNQSNWILAICKFDAPSQNHTTIIPINYLNELCKKFLERVIPDKPSDKDAQRMTPPFMK